MVNLVLTNSYFNLFPILMQKLTESGQDLNKKKLVFCEAKVSLMVERYICATMGGTFNTDVFSFGKFLCDRKKLNRVLSKEGSSMAIKRILQQVNLACFKQSRTNLAPSLYDLFIQLKSAKIAPQDILRASENTSGVLKNKLADIYVVYSAYQNFLTEQEFEDQSSILEYLPEIIDSDESLSSTDVFLVGFGNFTAQIRSAIFSLMEKAKSVTAILVEGDNPFVFVNETASFIRAACVEKGYNLLETKVDGDYSLEGSYIIDNLFDPKLIASEEEFRKNSDKIYYNCASNPFEEITQVGEAIKRAVISGKYRYKDITIATPNIEIYKDDIKSVFSALDIPFFLDEQIIPLNHPLVTLILSYVECFRKGFERDAVLSFVKNPLVTADKNLCDIFENYLIKYNINYKRIFEPLSFELKSKEQLSVLESLRQKICSHLSSFDVRKLLNNLHAEDSLNKLTSLLSDAGDKEQAAVTGQIYESVTHLLDEMDLLLDDVKLSFNEFKNLFISGVSAMKLSIIPQYNDAVFIGGFKESALAKAKILFAIGLTSDVPSVQTDMALLSDADINSLEQIKVLVEPKIKVVNHRTRENVGTAVSAFSDKLYLSYPVSSVDGKENLKSQVISDIGKLYNLIAVENNNGYLTRAQGVKSFAKACGEFAYGAQMDNFGYDFTIPSSFFKAVDGSGLQDILSRANLDVKERLGGKNVSLIKNVVSPTALEEYYKCPYRAFAERTLKIKEREEGDVNVLSVGNVMHEILDKFVDRICDVKDRDSSDKLFEFIKEQVLSHDEYKKFLNDSATSATLSRVLRECKEYCFKTYQNISNAKFDIHKTEANFGDEKNCDYPAISLLKGKIKLKGKIDRVDENDKFFRVVDYKTGKTDPSDKALYAGVKLQLYLYATAVMEKYKDGNIKQPVGLYYLPISDKYEKEEDKKSDFAVGKTLEEQEALSAQGFSSDAKVKNGTSQTALNKRIEYAVKASELAATRLLEGVIKPTPYEDACEYCEFSALCGQYNPEKRTVGDIKAIFDKKQ